MCQNKNDKAILLCKIRFANIFLSLISVCSPSANSFSTEKSLMLAHCFGKCVRGREALHISPLWHHKGQAGCRQRAKYAAVWSSNWFFSYIALYVSLCLTHFSCFRRSGGQPNEPAAADGLHRGRGAADLLRHLRRRRPAAPAQDAHRPQGPEGDTLGRVAPHRANLCTP